MTTRASIAGIIIALTAVAVPASSGAERASTNERVLIKGSNTFGEELAPRLVAAYRTENPMAVIVIESKGSGTGISALLSGECDIASSSRYATEDELRLARSRGLKLKSTLIGFYGVGVVTNAANGVNGLTDSEVRKIFTGTITNWKAVGGADATIHVHIRDKAAGAYLGFQELAMERSPYTPEAKMHLRDAEIIDAVKQDPAAIGFASAEFAHTGGVKGLRINNVPPTQAKINSGDYPFSRGLRFYTITGQQSKAADKFIGFVLSRKGQNEAAKAGFIGLYEHTIPSFEW